MQEPYTYSPLRRACRPVREAMVPVPVCGSFVEARTCPENELYGLRGIVASEVDADSCVMVAFIGLPEIANLRRVSLDSLRQIQSPVEQLQLMRTQGHIQEFAERLDWHRLDDIDPEYRIIIVNEGRWEVQDFIDRSFAEDAYELYSSACASALLSCSPCCNDHVISSSGHDSVVQDIQAAHRILSDMRTPIMHPLEQLRGLKESGRIQKSVSQLEWCRIEGAALPKYRVIHVARGSWDVQDFSNRSSADKAYSACSPFGASALLHCSPIPENDSKSHDGHHHVGLGKYEVVASWGTRAVIQDICTAHWLLCRSDERLRVIAHSSCLDATSKLKEQHSQTLDGRA